MPRRLLVVRHGETEWNAQLRIQGRLDSALTPLGKRQADANGQLLRRLGVERLLVSPLGRTLETAYIVNSHVQTEIELFDELMERDCGEWGGLTIDEIRSERTEEWRARQTDEWGHRPPGGENLPDVLKRLAPLLEAVRELEEEAVAIISHGVVGKAILSHYLQLGEQAAQQVRQPNEVVYELQFAAGQGVQSAHYVNGTGPIAGFLSKGDATTQPRLQSE